jgi:hypothetical protein
MICQAVAVMPQVLIVPAWNGLTPTGSYLASTKLRAS